MCAHICVYICVFTCIYVCLCRPVFMLAIRYICVFICVHINIRHICVFICVVNTSYMCVHINICVYTRHRMGKSCGHYRHICVFICVVNTSYMCVHTSPYGQVMWTLTPEETHKLWVFTTHSGTKRFAFCISLFARFTFCSCEKHVVHCDLVVLWFGVQ